MLRKLWTRLFPRRYSMCGADVPRGSAGAVRYFRKWCCAQLHADACACRLYKTLDEFLWRHADRHRVYVPRLTASTMDLAVSGPSGAGPGTLPLPTCQA
jgi:hypothetical protein